MLDWIKGLFGKKCCSHGEEGKMNNDTEMNQMEEGNDEMMNESSESSEENKEM